MTRKSGRTTLSPGHSWLACYPMPSTAAYVRLCWGHRVKLPDPLARAACKIKAAIPLNRVGRARSAHDLTTSQQGRARTIRARLIWLHADTSFLLARQEMQRKRKRKRERERGRLRKRERGRETQLDMAIRSQRPHTKTRSSCGHMDMSLLGLLH